MFHAEADAAWSGAGSRPRWWLRLLPLLFALVIFELTADPALVVVVGCSKVGWTQWRAAFWLRRVDPDRRRGRACSWFYAAWGLMRVSLVATTLMFACALLAGVLEGRGRNPAPGPQHIPLQFVSAALLALAGFLLMSGTTLVAVCSAWRSRVKVWVGGEVLAAWRSRRWPPAIHDPYRGPRNRIHALLLAALAMSCPVWLGVPGGLAIALVVAFAPQNGRSFLISTGTWVAIVGLTAAMMFLVDIIKRRIAAICPRDCWPEV